MGPSLLARTAAVVLCGLVGSTAAHSHRRSHGRKSPPQPPSFSSSSDSWANAKSVSVKITGEQSVQIEAGLNADAEVTGVYADNMDSLGWGQLQIQITPKSGSVSDDQRGFAAGAAEGYLTAQRLYLTYRNMIVTDYWNFTEGPPQELVDFMDDQQSYMDGMIQDNPNSDFWRYASVLNQQLLGLQYGYNLAASEINDGSVPQLKDLWPFQFLNLEGDLLDLMTALDIPGADGSPAKPTTEEWMWLGKHGSEEEKRRFHHKWLRSGHCSALVKVTPLMDDLMISHSSWFTYQNTNRVFKHYIFQFANIDTAARQMSFSSYPGFLESLDDFYLMDSGLAMLQTTNEIPNSTVYEYVTSNSLYAWQRVRIANALSSNGEQWYQNLANQNSGTYNNQYMVVNWKAFVPNEPLPQSGFLTIVEQMPGLVAMMDGTQEVKRGYWASYNVPAIEEIYNKSGYPELVDSLGPSYSYDLAPRARIFRRDANSVRNFDDLKRLMRYNNYQNDPIENGDPWWAICSRGDLDSEDPSVNGCYDTKAANYSMILQMTAEVVNAPTYDDLPAFDWADWSDTPHAGIKQVMNYPWATMFKY